MNRAVVLTSVCALALTGCASLAAAGTGASGGGAGDGDMLGVWNQVTGGSSCSDIYRLEEAGPDGVIDWYAENVLNEDASPYASGFIADAPDGSRQMIVDNGDRLILWDNWLLLVNPGDAEPSCTFARSVPDFASGAVDDDDDWGAFDPYDAYTDSPGVADLPIDRFDEIAGVWHQTTGGTSCSDIYRVEPFGPGNAADWYAENTLLEDDAPYSTGFLELTAEDEPVLVTDLGDDLVVKGEELLLFNGSSDVSDRNNASCSFERTKPDFIDPTRPDAGPSPFQDTRVLDMDEAEPILGRWIENPDNPSCSNIYTLRPEPDGTRVAWFTTREFGGSESRYESGVVVDDGGVMTLRADNGQSLRLVGGTLELHQSDGVVSCQFERDAL